MKVLKETGQGVGVWVWVAALLVISAGAWLLYPRADAVDPDRLWREAESDIMAGRIEPAEKALARLKALRPPTPVDHLLTAQVAIARGRPEPALAELALVPDDHPMAARSRMLAGQLELRRNRVRKAERMLRAAVTLDPKLVQAHRELIYIYGILLRRRELSDEFRALSAVAPMTMDDVWKWCLTRNSVWEARELTDQLEGYLKADPDDRMSRLALADNYRARNRPRDAETLLGPLGDDPDALAIRARMALDRGDDEAAEALLKNGPADHAELARLRGRIALARQDGPAALASFRAAYKADPDHRDALFGLGQALVLTGDPKAAAPFLASARDHEAFGSLMQRVSVRENRGDVSLLRALGAASEKIHRLPEARAWYRLVLATDPLDPEAQKAIFRIQAEEKKLKSG